MSGTTDEYEIGYWNDLRLSQRASARNRTFRMKPETIEHTDSDSEYHAESIGTKRKALW